MKPITCVCVWLILLYADSNALADEVDDRFVRLDRECFEQMPATFAQCERYIAELEVNAKSDDNARLLHSAGLSRLGNFTTDPELSASRKELARTGLNEYLAKHPNDVSALFELSGLVDAHEQIDVMKRIVGVDRSNAIALRLLVRGLSSSDDEDDHILAFGYLEQGYQETTGTERLSFGSWMFEGMIANGHPANAVQIQQRIAADFKLDAVDADAVPTDEDIAEFCQHGFLVVRLEGTCINLIYSAATASANARRPYSTPMLEAIELVLSSRDALGGDFPEYALGMRDVMEDHSDEARKSGYYYLVYSLVVTRDRKIAALRSALRQDDYHNARIRYWLAVALKDQGLIQQARAELEKVMRGDDENLAQVAEFELSILADAQP